MAILMAGPAGKPGPNGTIIPISRMAPRLAPAPKKTTTPRDQAKDKVVKKLATAKPKVTPKPAKLKTRSTIDDQYEAMVEFSPAYGSDAGRTYGPLSLTPGSSSPDGDKEYYCRLRIAQHRVDPLLQGFKTVWTPPPGWTRMDGLGTTLWDEAISNPLYVTRVYKTPSTISLEVGFLVVVKLKYKP